MCKDYGKTSTKALLTSLTVESLQIGQVLRRAAPWPPPLPPHFGGTILAPHLQLATGSPSESPRFGLCPSQPAIGPSQSSATGIPALHSSHPLYPSLSPRYVPKHQGKKRQALPFLVPSESSEPRPFDHSDILTAHLTLCEYNIKPWSLRLTRHVESSAQ